MGVKRDFAEQRRLHLREHILSNNEAEVSEMARMFGVTEATIRRDFIMLEQEGAIHRTHGGAIPRERPSLWQTTSLQDRIREHQEEKDRIANYVASLINNGESIMIDGGSTTLAVARYLISKKKLLLVTNTTTIAELALANPRAKVVVTGGEMIEGTLAMVGPLAEEIIRRHRTDKAIIGVSGILLDEGLFSAIPQEAEIKRLMIQNARETIVVADSSKIGTRALCLICTFKEISTLVTDQGISKKARASLEREGVKVITV